jgi:hypothetical protein
MEPDISRPAVLDEKFILVLICTHITCYIGRGESDMRVGVEARAAPYREVKDHRLSLLCCCRNVIFLVELRTLLFYEWVISSILLWT